MILELALDDLGLGATAGARNLLDVLVIGSQDGLQLRQESVRLHFGVYLHHRALVLECSRIDAVRESRSNTVDDESVDVGDNPGVDDVKLLEIVALYGRIVACKRLQIVCCLDGSILRCIMPLPPETASKM